MTVAQWAWIVIDAVALVAVFGAGLYIGAHALAKDPITITETIYRPEGDFNDVEMLMPTEGGNAFRFRCDMHFPTTVTVESLEPPQSTAECEYVEP